MQDVLIKMEAAACTENKQKVLSSHESSNIVLHVPNNEVIEDLQARPGAYHIPGIGVDLSDNNSQPDAYHIGRIDAEHHEDTNQVEPSFIPTLVATLAPSQNSVRKQMAVATPLRATLLTFKDRRVQFALFAIAVVILSLSFGLGLSLDNRGPTANISIATPSGPPSFPPSNGTNTTSDIPTTQWTHFPSASPTHLSSAYPTYLPSGIPSDVKTLSISTAMEIFVPISGEESLKNETSPQYLAMDWIVNHDGANITLKEEDKIIQRYVLAVFYFSTQGKNWKNQYNFLSDKDVCDWNGYKNSTMKNVDEFSGIQRCDEAGNVVNIELGK